MDSGETKHPQGIENVSTSPKRQGEADAALPVGLTHSSDEVQEIERSEGVGRDGVPR